MAKIRFLLTNVWIWLIMVLACFLGENYAWLTPRPNDGFDTGSFIAVTMLCLLTIVVFFVLERKKNHLKTNKLLAIILTAAFICFSISIWLVNDQTFNFGTKEVEVTFTVYEKIRANIVLFINVVFVYILFHPMVKGRKTHKALLWLHYGIIIVTYVTIIYSIAIESDLYLKSFTEKVSIKAFYLNENAFGIGVYLALLSCVALNMYKRHWTNYVHGAVFFTMIVIIDCATTLALGIATVIIFFFIDVISGFKNSFRSSLVVLFGGVIVFSAIAVLMFIGLSKDHPSAVLMLKKLNEIVDVDNMRTVESRVDIWRICLDEVFDSPLHLLFGRGYTLHAKYVTGLTSAYWNGPGVRSCHNAYVTLIMSNGILGMLAYLAAFGYLVYCGMRLLTRGKYKFVFTHILYLLLIGVYGMFETHTLFEIRGKEMFTTIIYFMPIIIVYKNEFKHKDEPVVETVKNHVYNPEQIASIVSILLISVVVGCICIVPNQFMLENPSKMVVFLIIALGVSGVSLFVPYAVYLWLNGTSPFMGRMNVIFNTLGLLFIPTIIFFMLFNNPNRFIVAGIVLGTLFIADIIIYSIIRKDYFRSYVRISIYDPIISTLIPMVVSILFASSLSVIFSAIVESNALTSFAFGVIGFVCFHALVEFLPNRVCMSAVNYLNEALLVREDKLSKKGDSYGR